MLNIKNVPFEYQVKANEGTFEGYAAVFDNKDLVNDILRKGSFTKTIQERFEQSEQIKILWQHDPYSPIGKPLAMSEDSKGLHVKGKLVTEVEKAREALALMKEGIIDSLSIGYEIVKDRLSNDGQVRELLEVRLFEFSPVTFPANPKALITGVKQLENFHSIIKDLDVAMLLKEGRVLSKNNRSKIESAINALQEVLSIDPSNADSQKEKDFDPDLKTFSQILEDMKKYAKRS